MQTTAEFKSLDAPDLTPLLRANRSIRVRAADVTDIPFLSGLFSSDEISYRWIFRGRTATMDAIRMNLQRPDLLPHIIETTRDRRRLGYTSAFDISDRNSHAQVGTVVAPDHINTGLGATATVIFADYLFAVLPLRKIYLQSIEYSYRQYASLVDRGYATSEGVLREHEYFAGRYWDVHILSVNREQFLKLRDQTRLYDR